MADAEALAGSINKRKSRKDHDSSSTRSRGSRRRRRPSLSKKGGSGKDKKWAKEDSYFETFSEKMSKAERRRDTAATKEATASESASKVEADGGTKPADFTKATTAEGTEERWSAAEPNEPAGTTASTAAAESTTRKGSKERSSKRRSKKRESDSAIQGFNVTDLAKALLDVLEAEQQQQQQLQQPQTQAISQPPCEVCIAARESSNQCMACEDSRPRDRPEVSRRSLWCDKRKTPQSDDRPDTPTRRGRQRPLRGRRRNRGVYYDDELDEEEETYDEEHMVTRRKPRKVFARSKRGRRGKGRHASQRPLAIEETTSTKVVETRDQSRSPYAPWDPRLIHPPPGDGEQYYGEGYGPFDVCGPVYYPPPEDAFLDYFGDPMDPWSPQGYPYWCGPCGAGVPGEWPTPYAPHCPCVAAAAEPSPTQGTIVRREEVWTEGGRHRHRVQEILEGGEPASGSPDVGFERFQARQAVISTAAQSPVLGVKSKTSALRSPRVVDTVHNV
ncbi:uncharacterized protein LOC142771361 [Rhipicephalus microplus]|uniref:uncharacterized protein LOC142771361 n=1 Tax=Rhipicephalus microplus TaxID=6941 RepID=UPI003F6AE4B9